LATNVVLNGSTYSIPAVGDSNWGTNLSNFFIAIGSGTLQKTGGAFTLTAETDFGATYGLKSAYLKSRATNPSATGVVRLGNTELVSWRNAGNSADLGLTVSASNALQFNSVSLLTSGSIVDADVNAAAAIAYSKLNLALSIVNADISASAAIVYSKLSIADADLTIAKTSGLQSALDLKAPAASPTFTGTITTPLTASRAVVTGASSELAAATTTAAEIGFVNGVTSAIQTQLDAKVPKTLTTTTGDMIYASSANTPARLAIGSSNQVIKSVGGVPVWSAAPSGGVNYLSAGTDGDSIASWVTYADAAATSPVDGTGGSPSSTFAVSTDSSIRGTTNFLWTHSAANRQGEGFSTNFTIDPSDKGKVIQCSFEYLVASGTYADDDLQFWIYDVTNAVLIQPAPYKLKNSGIIEKFAFEFQTSSSSTSYRLIAHVATTTAAAYTIRFDNWNLGPQAKLYGSPVTDWVSYTPTGTWSTNTTYTGKYRRVGDSAEFEIQVAVTGAPTSADLNVNLPSGMSIDTAKLVAGSATQGAGTVDNAVYGVGSALVAGARYRVSVALVSATAVRPRTGADAGSGFQADNTTITQASPATWASGNTVIFNFKVPIVGWSSSVVMSNDAATNVVAFQANGSASVPSASIDVLWTTTSMSSGSYNAATGEWTVPVAGDYLVQFNTGVTTTGGHSVNQYNNPTLKLDGTNVLSGLKYVESTSVQTFVAGNSGVVRGVLAGQKFKLNESSNISGTLSLTGATSTQLSISRISGPAQIAASDSVNISYTNSAGTTLTKSSSNIVPFATKIYDSHGAFVTDTFTAPISGTYQVSAGVLIANGATWAAGDAVNISIQNNGTDAISTSFPQLPNTVANIGANVSGTVKLLAGQTIKINVNPSKAAAGNVTLQTAAAYNYLTITRTGNY
jgi:hypothetical protein